MSNSQQRSGPFQIIGYQGWHPGALQLAGASSILPDEHSCEKTNESMLLHFVAGRNESISYVSFVSGIAIRLEAFAISNSKKIYCLVLFI